MTVLLGALFPFAIATIVVLLTWRIFTVKRPYLWLTVIYAAMFVLWHLSITLLAFKLGHPHGIEEWLAVSFLYLLALHVLLGNYTCIEGDSPSMMLFTLIDESGPDGCDRDTLVKGFKERGSLEARLETMEGYGLLQRRNDGTLTATALGRLIRWGFDVCFSPLDDREAQHD